MFVKHPRLNVEKDFISFIFINHIFNLNVVKIFKICTSLFVFLSVLDLMLLLSISVLSLMCEEEYKVKQEINVYSLWYNH